MGKEKTTSHLGQTIILVKSRKMTQRAEREKYHKHQEDRTKG